MFTECQQWGLNWNKRRRCVCVCVCVCVCLILRCSMSYCVIRSSFTTKTSSTGTFVPAAYWSPRSPPPSCGASMGSTPGRTRRPQRWRIRVWRNGRHQSCWSRNPPVRAATCEFISIMQSLLSRALLNRRLWHHVSRVLLSSWSLGILLYEMATMGKLDLNSWVINDG